MNWKDFGARNQRLNPLWSLGAGMHLGDLNPYKEMLALSILLQVYYLELESNEQRSKEDIIRLAWSSLDRFQIEQFGTIESVERLVDGLLWSGTGNDFESLYYDDQTQSIETQKFKYFTVDEDATRSSWENSGKTIFRLSEYGLELIFMSHEIIEEFQISIKLLEIQMHIKHGRVTRALQDVNELIARVRKMIQHQKEYRNAIRRNPKHMFSEIGNRRQRRMQEVQLQFDEERKHFDNIHRSMQRLSNEEKDLIDFNELRRLMERVELSRRVHDELAEVVLNIFEQETNLRLNYVDLLWSSTGINFREDIWEQWIKQQGLPEANDMEKVISGIFTPKLDFMYPLEWAIEEHDIELLHNLQDLKEEDNDQLQLRDIYAPRLTPWEDILELWVPIIQTLCKFGEYTFSASNFNERQRYLWSHTPEAVDFWLQFYNTDITVNDARQKNMKTNESDECLTLLNRVLEYDESLHSLRNKIISTTIQNSNHKQMIRWSGFAIMPFTMKLMESRG